MERFQGPIQLLHGHIASEFSKEESFKLKQPRRLLNCAQKTFDYPFWPLHDCQALFAPQEHRNVRSVVLNRILH